MKQKLISFILAYFRFFAKLQLLKINPIIVGITGSAGKTSTRDAVFATLKDKYKVKVSYKANSETGIPLNILGLTPENFTPLEWVKLILLCPVKIITNWKKYDVYLVEMGIDSPLPPKNMSYLLSILKPNISIMLNAAPMHSQPFDFLVKTNNKDQRAKELTKLIANEKGKIVTQINSNQTAILNIDQKELEDLIPNIKAKLTSFGKSLNANIKITNYKLNKTGSEFSFLVKQSRLALSFQNQVLPKHFTHTFAAAIGVGLTLNMTLNQIKSSLEKNFKLAPGRSSLIPGINNSLIIDSSYNSSTKPAIDMLDLLHKIPGNRKLALLGDIRELGEVSQTEHQKVINHAMTICDEIFLVGPQMKEFALPLIEKSKIPAKWFKNGYQAADFLQSKLKKDDVLLVKASQNTLLLEITVEKLMAHPNNASQLLARRGEFWNEKRAELNK
jgi:UDP-N-acetylmuramoyl-tripeptide--D-alanyl-D-alanine ligase